MSAAQTTLPPPSTALRLLEARVLPEFGAFWLMPPMALRRHAAGDGHPVLVLSGLLADDGSTYALPSFLDSYGYSPVRGMVWKAPVSNLLPRTPDRFPDRRSGDMAAATLIVNDDDSVCEATIDLHRAMGFVAKGSHSAEDFLESNHLGRTSCLIADMRMPGMSGPDLHVRLVRSGKDIRTILTTAFPNDRDRARSRPASSAAWPSHSKMQICSGASDPVSSLTGWVPCRRER